MAATLRNMKYHQPRVVAASLLIATLLAASGGCIRPSQAPITAWVFDAGQAARPDMPPSAENAIYSSAAHRVKLEAGVQETVAFQVGLRAAAWPAPSVDVRLNGLQGAGAAQIPPEAIRIYRQQTVEIANLPAWYRLEAPASDLPLEVCDVLVPWDAPRGGGPVRPQRSSSTLAWVDVHVPPGTPPGIYRGKLEVIARGAAAPAYACDVTLRVLAAALPSEPSLHIVAPVDPRGLLAEQLGWPIEAAETTRILPDEPSHAEALRLVDSTMALLHAHRITPVLWASFPKLRTGGGQPVEVEWDAYDALVSRWIDGSAYADRARSPLWLLPISEHYPDMRRNGGAGSASYARLLAAYLRACRTHFQEKGWAERALLRILTPRPLSATLADEVHKLAGIVAAGDGVPLVVHLPGQSLAGLGWAGAPKIDIAAPARWAPPASWFEPAAMARRSATGQRVMFIPQYPPYSPSLAQTATATDAQALGWLAYRYGCDGVWIENALPAVGGRSDGKGEPLVVSGKPYGVSGVVPTVRLKRLRRGAQDVDWLRLLEQSGKPALAKGMAERLVAWGFTDACVENLLSTRGVGWLGDPATYDLARRLLRHELVREFAAPAPGDPSLSQQWEQVMRSATRVELGGRGARLYQDGETTRAALLATVTNRTSAPVSGTLQIPELPVGWTVDTAEPVRVAPAGTVRRELRATIGGLAYNADGVLPLEMVLDSGVGEPLKAPLRVALTSCPLVAQGPRIDGDLSDWVLNVNNTAGDFQLVRGFDSDGGTRPAVSTRAYFCVDAERLYVAVACELVAGQRPMWNADNVVHIDGAVPWGEDLVELIIAPQDTPVGTGADLYTLQIKPSGLLVARHGPLIDPPLNASTPWAVEPRAAVHVGRRAWTVEVAIPLRAFGDAAGAQRLWGLNVARVDARHGEYSSWSGARGYCYLPELLGNLILQRP